MDCCCPRLSAWWYLKVSIALGLAVHGVVFAATGWTIGDRWGVPFWVAQSVVAVGAILVTYHYLLLKKSTRNIAEPESLITGGGLFRWIRHPMYLGDWIVIAGLALFCPNVFATSLVLLGGVALVGLCRHEDSLMASRFGEEFDGYRERTRTLIPFVL